MKLSSFIALFLISASATSCTTAQAAVESAATEQIQGLYKVHLMWTATVCRRGMTQRMALQYTHERHSTGWTGKLPQSSRLK